MKFRCIVALAMMMVTLCSCNSQWKYQTIEVEGQDNGKIYPMDIPISDSLLNRMGSEGWELVSCYPLVETSYADLGNEGFIIQIKSNARTCAIRYVFKKKCYGDYE